MVNFNIAQPYLHIHRITCLVPLFSSDQSEVSLPRLYVFWMYLLHAKKMLFLLSTATHALFFVPNRDWKVADCSLVDSLIAKKLILPTFQLDAPVLPRARVKLSCGTSQFIGSS